MEEQEFLRMAKQMKVANTLYTYACVVRDGVLKDASSFGDIDWRATSLNLASALDKSRDSIELIEAPDQRNLQNLEDKQAELSELQGRLEGRTELLIQTAERNISLQEQLKEARQYLDTIESLALSALQE